MSETTVETNLRVSSLGSDISCRMQANALGSNPTVMVDKFRTTRCKLLSVTACSQKSLKKTVTRPQIKSSIPIPADDKNCSER